MIKYENKIADRQVGRNADLFAMEIGGMSTPEERYGYIRILISIIEQAHPEWNQAPNKDKQIAHLVFHMSHGAIPQEETIEIVQLRDEERGITNHHKDRLKAKQEVGRKEAEDAKEQGDDEGVAEEEVEAAEDGAETEAQEAEPEDESDDEEEAKADTAEEDADDDKDADDEK